MTMIRPKIKGLKMTQMKPKGSESVKETVVGRKGKGKLKGEFLGTSKMVT